MGPPYYDVFLERPPVIRYIFFLFLTYFWEHLFNMADEAGSARPKRTLPPNNAELKKAQTKFPTFNAAAKTEYERLKQINEDSPFVPNKNPVEHARWYHLSELKSKCERVLFFILLLNSKSYFFIVLAVPPKETAPKKSAPPSSPGGLSACFSVISIFGYLLFSV